VKFCARLSGLRLLGILGLPLGGYDGRGGTRQSMRIARSMKL
jgi:hypothetical protein